ncbi:uncharacterized protein UTRI_02636_B [Ustilago trichophora]|uniref:Uncharacterized protein n=1 Tax=Ustilago trichophora TaxID=86804 RepID=A0A5C3E7P2_9BASI|nr:uncharacterized protein UTRI_02636_B [Ustilago trichophora]
MQRYTALKLAISLAFIFLPLVKSSVCQPRTIVQPDNKEFLSLCGSEDGAADVAKTDPKHPCFSLLSGDLHNVQVDITTLPDAKPGKSGRIIVKDGDLTSKHCNPSNHSH